MQRILRREGRKNLDSLCALRVSAVRILTVPAIFERGSKMSDNGSGALGKGIAIAGMWIGAGIMFRSVENLLAVDAGPFLGTLAVLFLWDFRTRRGRGAE
jgi:hypothetical protein